MAPREENEYSQLAHAGFNQDVLLFPTAEMAHAQLLALGEYSGTGPDDTPTRTLRTCALELATPIAMLTTRILACLQWPESWKVHLMVPLFKRDATFLAKKYRGGPPDLPGVKSC